MNSGLPIAMSPCEGSKELIRENGIISDSDLKQFDTAILELIVLSSEKLRKMGQMSRKRAEKHFSWSVIAESYIQVLESVMNKKDAN